MEAKPKILVADDCSALLDALQFILGEQGFDVVTFPDKVEALKTLRAGLSPDLILTDWSSPRMDGGTFIHAIREFLPHVPIIILSGSGRSLGAVPCALRYGVHAIIDKPCPVVELQSKINSALLSARS